MQEGAHPPPAPSPLGPFVAYLHVLSKHFYPNIKILTVDKFHMILKQNAVLGHANLIISFSRMPFDQFCDFYFIL